MSLTSAAPITHPPASRWGVCFVPVYLLRFLLHSLFGPYKRYTLRESGTTGYSWLFLRILRHGHLSHGPPSQSRCGHTSCPLNGRSQCRHQYHTLRLGCTLLRPIAHRPFITRKDFTHPNDPPI